MNYGLQESDIQEIHSLFKNYPSVKEVMIFGSRAMGNETPGSDIDLVVTQGNIDIDTLTRIHYILEEELPLPYHFDLIDYSGIDSPALKQHINEHGKVFYRLSS